jgi:hypothetical protein
MLHLWGAGAAVSQAVEDQERKARPADQVSPEVSQVPPVLEDPERAEDQPARAATRSQPNQRKKALADLVGEARASPRQRSRRWW